MIQIVEQTHEEKINMYMKSTKKELINMLIESNKLLTGDKPPKPVKFINTNSRG